MLNNRMQNLDTKIERSRYQKGDVGHLDTTKKDISMPKKTSLCLVFSLLYLFCFALFILLICWIFILLCKLNSYYFFHHLWVVWLSKTTHPFDRDFFVEEVLRPFCRDFLVEEVLPSPVILGVPMRRFWALLGT